MSMDSEPRGALCAIHPERSAATICNRCGNYACELCFQVGADRQDYCTDCLPRAEPQLATRSSRLGAVIVDQLFVMIPLFVGILLGSLVDKDWGAVLFGGVAAVFVLCYQLYVLTEHGQTFGKRMMGIKVVRMDGSAVGLGRLLVLRNVVPALIGSATCNVFSLVDSLAIFAESSRCLHDYIADTKVIDVGPSSR